MFIIHALQMSLAMGWQILWPLVLGFALSGAIQAVVSHYQMSKLLPDSSPKTLLKASLLGAASSSCSYAAVAMARSVFRKGGNFAAAMTFEIASTNLVIELGIITWLLLGWQFALAEIIGGIVMILTLSVLFRKFLTKQLLQSAAAQTHKGLSGRMEGHAAMDDMAIKGDAPVLKKLFSKQGITATSHFFVMDWASIWSDIVIGLLIAGALAAWVPEHFWQSFFFAGNPVLAAVWGPIVGPIIAMLSFVCSVGNIPLAVVLWNGGISFGGVASFIFADLIIVPILLIYKKYYGLKMSGFILATFYAAMVVAGYVVEGLFALFRLTPTARGAATLAPHLSFNYTTVLNIVLLLLAGALVWRFMRTGGPMMLKMMNKPHSHDQL